MCSEARIGTHDEIGGLRFVIWLKRESDMKARIAGLVAVAALLIVNVPSAEARPFGMHGGFGHVGGGWGHGGWGHGGWGHGGWGGVGFGLATGALVGAALASPYYGYGYGYPYYDYGYDYGYPVAAYDDGYYGYAPAVSVGYVARPYWGHRRYYRAAYRPYAYGGAYRPYGYGVGIGRYGARVGHVGYRHAGFRSYGIARGGVHHGRFR